MEKNNIIKDAFNKIKEITEKEKTKKKDRKVLNPTAIEDKTFKVDNLEQIKKAVLDNNLISTENLKDLDINNTDNFFRAVILELLSTKNISLKTEYLSVNETFAGSKLEFLSKYASMPQLSDFLQILETKRVSLERKSRIELIKAFDKRDEEVDAQNRIRDFKSMLGM